MKYVDEFRDQGKVKKALALLFKEVRAGRVYRFLEFCGGHTHAIFRYGLPDILPKEIKLIHGPGCPVCVLPMSKVDEAIQLAQMDHVTLCTYGDMMRVPGGNHMSLLKAKAQGADVHMITSPLEALRLAQKNPDKEVIFFAIGFATTTPPTAHVLMKAKEERLKNFSVFCNHVLAVPPLKMLLDSEDDQFTLDGIIGPGHVASIAGVKEFDSAAKDYHKPVVVTGFEPLDLITAILMLVRQVNEGRAEVENEYSRAFLPEGNVKFQKMAEKVFDVRETFEWRGLGFIPLSALCIKDEYAAFDAEKRFTIKPSDAKDNPACQCPAILRGEKEPHECKLFSKACNPENPIGACMVSSEGGCAAAYSYGRQRLTGG